VSIEAQIHLEQFKPRSYQIPMFDAIENKGYKRVLAILPRRAGKDIGAWNLMIRAAITRIGTYYYLFPTYAQAKKVMWDGIDNDGRKILEYLPPQLIDSSNSQEMKIRLTNGSLIQFVGSDNVDSLVGTNPVGCIFSEYALQDPRAYQFIRPILTANGGWALFISTPRGKNHLWELYQIAQNSPQWFSYKLTIEDTNHIPMEEIEKERAEGIMSEDLIQQEYYTSFTMGVEGSYYSKYLDRMRLTGRIGNVPWESAYKVHTSWDIGYSDSCAIIFFQVVGQIIRIIDCYEKNKEGLEHYIKVIQSKPYQYGTHIVPHDMRVTEFGSGISRLDKARQLGINMTVADMIPIEDGIEAVRSAFSKMWIDENNCSKLLKALENYRQEYDTKKQIYKSNPRHDWTSHFSDSARYMCISLAKTADGMTPQTSEEMYQRSRWGNQGNLPSFFRDPQQEFTRY
jgi:phage terminase large subunit